jgi:hypothetical protein
MIIGLVVESTSIRMVNRQGTEKLDYWPKVYAHHEPSPEDCPLVIRSDFSNVLATRFSCEVSRL